MSIQQRFERRAERHDVLENKIMDIIRPYTDRRHLPDRRVSFAQTPVSWDLKTNIFVENNSHDEYFRLWSEGEPVFIVYQNGDGEKYGDGRFYADWIINLTWHGPFPASANSTCGDDYYRISGGRELMEFIKYATFEVEGWIGA